MIKALRLFLASLLSVGLLSFATAPAVSAADFDLFGKECTGQSGAEVCGPCNDNRDATVCQDAKSGDNPLYGPDGVIQLVVNVLAIVIGVAAIIIIIIAGIQYMLSTGDPTKVNNAKNAILYALIGLGIAVVARTIVVFILSKL